MQIGNEVVSYSGKLSDRFTGVKRGVNRNLGAWDLTTASYLNNSFDFSNEESINGGRDIYMSPNGEHLYIVGSNTDNIHQYTLSTYYNISTATFTNSFSIVNEEFNAHGLFFSPDGLNMYVSGGSDVVFSDSRIHQYSLSVAWDISTASYSNSEFAVDTGNNQTPLQLYIKSDGLTLFVMGGGVTAADAVFQYTLSSAWDISTATYDNITFSVNTEDNLPLGITFHPNGAKFFVSGTQNDSIYEYTMSTPWDITTATNTATRIVAGTTANPHGVYVDSSGDYMFVVGNDTSEVYEYIMSKGETHNAGDYLRSLV